MGIILIYALKSAICLSLFYLFYRLLLSKETFHRFNRMALLGILLLSLLIPFIEVTTTHQTEVNQTVITIEQLLMMNEEIPVLETEETVPTQPEVPAISWAQMLLLTYLVGICAFVCRNFYFLFLLLLTIMSGKRENLAKGIILIIHERDVTPFSWMKYIVISRKDLEENGKEILIHEMAHISNRHSVDLLLADICIFLQWFNPGAWLLKRELQNIHEYEADQTVVMKGVNVKEYQLLLIKKAVGPRLYSMANNFNHSKLKKRISMMLKEKSNPWARLKCLYVLPLAAVAVTAFARPEISEKVEEISTVKVSDLTAIVESEVKNISDDVLIQSVKSVEPAKPKVRVSVGDSLKKCKTSVTYKYLADSAAFKKDEFAVFGISTKNIDKDKKPLVFINGVEVTGDDPLSEISPSVIESFSVLKRQTSIENYGEKGKNGVLFITLKSGMKLEKNKDTEKIQITSTSVSFKDVTKNNPLTKTGSVFGTDSALILVNDKVIQKEDLEKIPIDRIESFSILKGESATSIYGDVGKNGVILITLCTDEGYAEMKRKQTNESGIVISEKTSDWIMVTGVVKDEDGNPLRGATVIVKGIISTGVVTDKDGHFSLKAPKDAELQILYVGMAASIVKASSKVAVTMKKIEKSFSANYEQKTVLIVNGEEMKETPKKYAIINGKGTVNKDTIRVNGELIVK